jgi:hypothetical protein
MMANNTTIPKKINNTSRYQPAQEENTGGLSCSGAAIVQPKYKNPARKITPFLNLAGIKAEKNFADQRKKQQRIFQKLLTQNDYTCPNLQ